MQTYEQVKKLLLAVVAILALTVAACSDDSGGGTTDTEPTDTGGGDGTADVPDTAEDMLPDTGGEDVPEEVAEEPDAAAEPEIDLGPDEPLNLCATSVPALTADDGALQSAIGIALGACGRGDLCVTCALGTTSACTGLRNPGDEDVDCTDPTTPDEECTLSACIGRCVAENDFDDDACVDASDCATAMLPEVLFTCDGDSVCRLNAATAINASVDGGGLEPDCFGCFSGITQCIADQGCSASCLSGECACDTCQCEEGCVDDFVLCSGLPPTVDCSDPPDSIDSCNE